MNEMKIKNIKLVSELWFSAQVYQCQSLVAVKY